MTRNSGPLPDGRGSHKMLVFAVLLALALLAAVVAVAVWAPWRQAAGSLAARINQDDLAAARDSRAAALRQVWRTLEEFRAAHGAWPADMDALRAFAPIVDDVLAPPPLSGEVGYTIDFEPLHFHGYRGPSRVIVDDPGFVIPGSGSNPDAFKPFRVMLLETGEVVTWAEAARRGAM